MHVHTQADRQVLGFLLTDDAQPLFGPSDANIYLVLIAQKAQMLGSPTSVQVLFNLLTRQRPHSGYDDITPFTS